MKAYVINLEEDISKRRNILKQLKPLNLEINLIPAINGKKLQKEELQKLVFDFPHCMLSLGEIGCALSHRNIYQKMVEENTNISLILEDDIILSDIKDALSDIENFDNPKKANVYILSYVTDYFPLSKKHLKNCCLYSVFRAYNTCGYIINKKAAEILFDLQTPIKFEADMWEYFKLICGLNVYCAIPYFVKEGDPQKQFSRIEKDREILKSLRTAYRGKMVLKNYSFSVFKKFFYRVFLKLFTTKNKYKN